MQRCPHCHFPCPTTAAQCGWCAKPLPAQPAVAVASPYAQASAPPVPPPSVPPQATPPPSHQPRSSGFLVDHAPLLSVATDPSASGSAYQASHPSWASPPGYTPLTSSHVTGAPPSAPTAWKSTPAQVPQSASFTVWWLVVPALTLVVAWLLARDQVVWGHMLTTAAKALFVGATATVLVGLLLASWQRTMRAAVGPLFVAAALGLLGGGGVFFSHTATYLQAQQAEDRGDYARAVQLYTHVGSISDALRARVEWGQVFTDEHDFPQAQAEIQLALAHTSGPEYDQARAAMGHLLWVWGQALFAKHDLADTRAKWQSAATLAAGTADGDRAALALAAPQVVTGHMTWDGAPLPGEEVALVSSWQFTPQLHILQVQGTRLQATTGDDGSFSIQGVKPGVAYILIWQGKNGDVTQVDASGKPLYGITLQPLQGGDLGQISIDNAS
jgi:hypothetical protein